MPNRYRLKGDTLEEIRRKAEQQYGPAARIVSAERVISPGIAGLFAQDRYEAMVEVLPSHEVVSGEVVPDADILADAEPAPAHYPAGVDAGGKDTYDAGTAASAAASAGPSHHLQSAAIAALLEEADAAEL